MDSRIVEALETGHLHKVGNHYFLISGSGEEIPLTENQVEDIINEQKEMGESMVEWIVP